MTDIFDPALVHHPQTVICVDFDGTCVAFGPNHTLGPDVPGAVDVLRNLVANDVLLVLFTMRSGPGLVDAVNWFTSHNIPLYGVNTNPTQHRWTTSPKAYGNLFIDDAAVGCPLLTDPELSHRPFVDWAKVAELLAERL